MTFRGSFNTRKECKAVMNGARALTELLECNAGKIKEILKEVTNSKSKVVERIENNRKRKEMRKIMSPVFAIRCNKFRCVKRFMS